MFRLTDDIDKKHPKYFMEQGIVLIWLFNQCIMQVSGILVIKEIITILSHQPEY